MRACTFLTMVLVGLVTCVFLFPASAHAYLDPGTGSYIFQLVLAGIVGALFSITLFWRRIKLFFKNLSAKRNANEPHEQQ